MPSVFVICADCHIRAGESFKIEAITHIIEGLSRGEVLVIAGDFCDALVGKSELLWDWQKELLDIFRKAFAEGKRVIYVEGNRDFFLEYFKGKYFVDVQKEYCCLHEGSVVVVHGDLINRKDWKYRWWRGLVKSKLVFRAATRLIPDTWLIRIIFWLEKRMRALNQRFKDHIPLAMIRDFVAGIVPKPLIVVSGHFHSFIQESVNGILFISLPSWDEYPNVLRVMLDKESILYKLESL